MPGLARQGFVPRDYAGLVVEMDADLGVTLNAGKVETWTDPTSTIAYTQGTAANRPVVTAAVFGTRSGITGTAATSLIKAASPLAIGSDRTIFVVCKGAGSAGASGGLLCSFKGAGAAYNQYFWDLAPNIYCYSDGALADTIAGVTVVDTAHVYTGKGVVGSLPVIRIDGVNKTVSGGNNVVSDNGTDGASLFSATGADGFIGSIGAILIYNVALSTDKMHAIEVYLGAKFGVAVT